MLRGVLKLAILGVLVYLAVTVSFGNRTLFGHMQNIWASDETQELVDGVKDKVKRGLTEQAEEAARDELRNELPDTRIQASP